MIAVHYHISIVDLLWFYSCDLQWEHALQIRYAYELLTNPLWKRDYDIFGIDEQLVSTLFSIVLNLCLFLRSLL